MRKLDPSSVAVTAAILLHGGHIVAADDDARATVAVKRALELHTIAADMIDQGVGQRSDNAEQLDDATAAPATGRSASTKKRE